MSYDGSDDDQPSPHSFHHSRSSSSHNHHNHNHQRDLSPSFHYSGGSPSPYAAGAIPPPSQYEPPLHPVPLYAPMVPPYYPSQERTLQPPPSRHHYHHRAHSVPPPGSGHRGMNLAHRRDSASSSSSSSDSSCSSENHTTPASPLAKAKHALSHTFSSSTSGLGVGVLGAVLGGLAAREAGQHHREQNRGAKYEGEGDKGVLISTIVGAAVGGLGANAIEKRLEKSRRKRGDKGREREEKREGYGFGHGHGVGAGRKERLVEEGRARPFPVRRYSGAAEEYYSGAPVVGEGEWEGRRRRRF